MPKILIAGCGYIGRATAAVFHDAGWKVEGWTSSEKSARELATQPYSVRAVDLTNSEQVLKAASAADAIIHCASSGGGDAEDYRKIYFDGTRNLLAYFPNSLILFTSSTSVYAQRDGEWVTEESIAKPERKTARVLRETEDSLGARGGVVARLAGIYGPGRSALLRKFLEGNATIDSGPERFINQIHRDDAATALFFLIGHCLTSAARERANEPQIYNVSDNHPLTQRECYEWLAEYLRRPVPPEAEPGERKRGRTNKRVSSARLQALGWSPRYPTFQKAMTDSILPALRL